ncbi:MAG: hypothetical protein PHO92_04930 [Candidatus Peribacteraceae bacterium]|nr:hypothetical protein [Candidatus Peribacteraceae bacterium]
MNTLILTADERKIFDTLPATLKEGWSVETEKESFQDSEEKLSMRLALLRLHDPKLLDLQKRAVGLSGEQLAALIAQTDLKGVADDDLAELTFAVGPSILGTLIGGLLQKVKTDAALEDIAALTTIRHSILASFVHA